MGIAPQYQPQTEQELVRCLADPHWRIHSGRLYKIIAKTSVNDSAVIPFVPNQAQQKLIRNLWHRNTILKARQLGFTTLVSILWLDHALFNADQRCAIIAHDRDSAEAIFKDKVKFAYQNLPQAIRDVMPLETDSATELKFKHNNSSVRVTTSARSGTYNRLHVSEFGKVCAKYPDKANEIVTGSLPAVPADGIVIVESTAEGSSGAFHDMCKRAEAITLSNKPLTKPEYRFHFFPWWQNPEYAMHPASVIITQEDNDYFDTIAHEQKTVITANQRAWYCAKRASDFAEQPEKMWQEFPSSPKESFEQSTEGCYYATQLAAARRDNRIGKVPYITGTPVNTCWDIGSADGTGVWLHQRLGAENHFIGYIEAWGESYAYFVQKLQATGYVFGRHYLPHDAGHVRQQATKIGSPIAMLQELAPGWQFEIVPPVDKVIHGIQKTRDQFSTYWFDETKCKEGIAHLGNYRKQWDARNGRWRDEPRHDEHSECADALRMFAQGYTGPSNRKPIDLMAYGSASF